MSGWELALGDWRDTLRDVTADAFVSDPPYGARTHAGHNAGEKQVRSATGQPTRRALSYAHLTPLDVAEIVASWSPRVRGWFVVFTSHDLVPAWEVSLEDQGRYVFAPLPVIMHRPRLIGDGPSCAAVWMVVARPRTTQFSRWGCLPGWYHPRQERGPSRIGGKPLGLMRAILGDYTDPGDTVVDPFAGYGTTLRAAQELGLGSIGAEVDATAYQDATTRLSAPFTPYPHPRASRAAKGTQGTLF